MKKRTTILLIALLIAGCWLASCSNTGQPSRNLQFEEITLTKSEHLFADESKPACNLSIDFAFVNNANTIGAKDSINAYLLSALFGKKIGGDICCNKKTFLLITAMNIASPEQLAEMKKWMAKSQFNAEEKVACFTRIYDELGVRDICEKRIQALFDECDQYIANVSVVPEKKKFLKEFFVVL